MYPALWQTQLLHKNNPVSYGDFEIFLVSNFARTNKFLNFFGCRVVRSIFFIIKCFLKFFIYSVFNAVSKLLERKLSRIVSSSEANNIFRVS